MEAQADFWLARIQPASGQGQPMSGETSRRQFLGQLGAAAAGMAVLRPSMRLGDGQPTGPARRSDAAPRVAIARDPALEGGAVAEHKALLRKLLDASVQKVTGAATADKAWQSLFRPDDRVGIKVNALGFCTQPAVVDAVVAGLRRGGVAAERIVIWDRFDVELVRAGFRLNKAGKGVRCTGTDAQFVGSGYQRKVETSGQIGSCFSRIVAEQVNALICVPVLKDHNLAGVSLGMKNFFGAIHNPNKYHDDNCDPFVVDVVSHRFIAPKWRLTVCDATRAQYQGGPARHPGYGWAFGGLVVGTDFVATDAVAADLLEQHRREKGLKSLAEERRPPRHIATAARRGLGEGDLGKIVRVEA